MFKDGTEICRTHSVEYGICYVGAYCSHAVLTVKVGVYRCPFKACFKRFESVRRERSDRSNGVET